MTPARPAAPPRIGPLARALGVVGALGALSVIGLVAGRVPSNASAATTPAASSTMLETSASPAPPLASSAASALAAPSASQAAGAAPPTPDAAPSATLADGRVVLNLATEDDLVKLPGIGPTRARAIVAMRQRMGRFKALADLRKVKGMGRKTLARLAPKVVLDPQP